LSRLRYPRRAAVEHLQRSCPRLAAFIDRQGPLKLRVQHTPELFGALARSIVYQQLSGRAAATIHARFCGLFEDGRPSARIAAALDCERLRAVGLSRSKALSIQDLARRTEAGSLPSLRQIARLADSEIVDALCCVRGIGPWTVQMFLIFNLGRPDVMPATDLGVQKGVRAIYGLRELPDPDRVLRTVRRQHRARPVKVNCIQFVETRNADVFKTVAEMTGGRYVFVSPGMLGMGG